jgi:GT2 family glycosyltransferase
MHESQNIDVNDGILKLFVVVVLYKQQPTDSLTLNTLQASISRIPIGKVDIELLLYDNTPGGQDIRVLPRGVQYVADIENGGLAKAYNYALQIAHDRGFDWLLVLDQDTSLPADFMCKLCSTIAFVTPLNEVAAIVPSIVGNGRLISPSFPTKRWLFTKRFRDGFIGISMQRLTLAVNSASTLRVSALRAAGGYDPRFWLDCSDVVMFHRLQLNGFRIFVAGNIHVEHEVSVLDLTNRATPGRYANILGAQEAYFDGYLGRIEGIVQLLKHVYLVVKLCKTGVTPPYFNVWLRFLCRRLFYSRKHRLRTWEYSAMRRSDV